MLEACIIELESQRLSAFFFLPIWPRGTTFCLYLDVALNVFEEELSNLELRGVEGG